MCKNRTSTNFVRRLQLLRVHRPPCEAFSLHDSSESKHLDRKMAHLVSSFAYRSTGERTKTHRLDRLTVNMVSTVQAVLFDSEELSRH